VDQDLKEAYNCFLEAHDLGVVQSTFLLGALYDRGEVPGYKRCIAKALLYYEMAAEKGHTDATYQAAYIYIQSHNLEIKNILKGVRWLHKAKDKGHMEALFLIGFYHEYGLIEDDKIYLERDQGKALSYYRLAAQKGHKEALRKLQDH
jgi:TPR repeat protein